MDLPELLALARRTRRDEFVRNFGHPFLERPRLQTAYGEDEDTHSSTNAPDFAETSSVRDALARPAAVRYVPLVRGRASLYSDRISAGRTQNCDIVLRHRSVSKLHALLWPHPDVTKWTISDARSANGTFLNGRRLEVLARVPLKSGDQIRIGRLETRFVDAALLYELLQRRLPRLPRR